MKNIINTLQSGLSHSGLRDLLSQVFEFFNTAICCMHDDCCADQACCCCCECCC